jgi:hypothetical protein
MKIVSLKNGQAIRFMNVLPTTGQTLYGINLVRAFEKRYGFFQSPTTLDGFDLGKGVTFRHGIFNGQVIDRVQIYNNGILAEGAIPTNSCFDFISDVIEFATKEAGIEIQSIPQKAALYNSTLHVEYDVSFEKHLQSANFVSNILSEKLAKYGADAAIFELSGLIFQSGVQTPFRVERLAGSPTGSNIYFTTAPLTTSDHEEVLIAIEDAFKAQSIA